MNWIDISKHLPITDPTWIFFLVLAVILLAPIVLGRLRIPHVIGMILAGVIIGQYGFNILERDSSFELFGRVGLYYIMFLAGLEMDLEDFKTSRLKVLVFGLLTFAIPMLLGVVSSYYILGYGVIASILLASMYASHTLVSYPILSRFGLSRLRSVGITIGGTAITDTFTLLILAVIAGMYKGDIGSSFWILWGIKVVLSVGFILIVFPRISRWFFRKYEDNIMQFVFVLAMVFLGGGLLELAGLEGILGAFLVGLVLNRLIPHLSPLMNRIEFVGNALFIPYFLIGVGMIINLKALFSGGQALKVALVMTVVATLSKWLAALCTQKIFRMKSVERSIIFGLSNARVAATLAAVLVGNKIEIAPGTPLINDDVLNGTIVMIMFTCIISSVVTQQAARRAALSGSVESNTTTTTTQQEEERILIPVANPDTIDNLINMALLIRNHRVDDSLFALHVINDELVSEHEEAKGQKSLDHAVSVGAAADVSIHPIMRFDVSMVSGVLHTMQEQKISEVVIGLHRKANLVDSFLGVKSMNLLNSTPKQIFIVRSQMPINTIRKIVVAVPPRAERESGFTKWVTRLCRMASQLGCRIQFCANQTTLGFIKGYVDINYESLRVLYHEFEHWDDLLLLTNQVNFDHLFVVVSARRGSISYRNSLEELPNLLSKYFSSNSLAILYPDQFGDSHEVITFAEPIRRTNIGVFQQVMQWFTNFFRNKA